MENIKPLTSILPISPTSSHSGERGQGQRPSVGQLLKATVVEASGANRFILDFAGNKQPVRSEATLSIGQTLQLQVTKTSPSIELKIVSDTLNEYLGRSLTLLNNIDLKTLFKGLQQKPEQFSHMTPASKTLLESFFSMQETWSDGKDGGTTLKQMIEKLWLNLESLIARGDTQKALNTLKAALLEVTHLFKNAESISDSTNKILTTIELFQFAQLGSGSNSLYIFPLPLPILDQGYLVIEKREEDENDSTSPEMRFSLHLSMSEIGNVRIDFLQTEEGLFLKFQAESQEVADFVQSLSEELKETISGVKLVSMTFSGDAPDLRYDLIQYILPEGKSVLDTTV